jgi:hypothetical protein
MLVLARWALGQRLVTKSNMDALLLSVSPNVPPRALKDVHEEAKEQAKYLILLW